MTRLYSERVVLGGSGANLRVEPAEITLDGAFVDSVEPIPRAALTPAADRCDLGTKLIAPAFINAHTHLALGCLRGLGTGHEMSGNVVEEFYYAIERHLDPPDVRAFARMGAYESLLAGVGTVWDHYYHARQVAAALQDTGLGGVVAPTLQDLHGPGADSFDDQIEATLSIAGDDGLANAGIAAALGPHATDTVSSELWKRVAALADEHELFIHAHVGQSIEEFERSIEQHGCSPIARLGREGVLDAGAGMLFVHGLFVSRDDLDRLQPGRHALGYCPSSQMQFGFPTNLGNWLERGLSIVVGTDCAACNDSMNVQKELRVAAGAGVFSTTHSAEYIRFRQSGSLEDARAVSQHRRAAYDAVPRLREPHFLLSTIWHNPGSLVSALPLGEIRAGARANLAVWDLDHPSCWPSADPLRALALADTNGALHGLMVSGRWTGELGDHARSLTDSDAYREARGEADRRLDMLLQRAGLSR